MVFVYYWCGCSANADTILIMGFSAVLAYNIILCKVCFCFANVFAYFLCNYNGLLQASCLYAHSVKQHTILAVKYGSCFACREITFRCTSTSTFTLKSTSRFTFRCTTSTFRFTSRSRSASKCTSTSTSCYICASSLFLSCQRYNLSMDIELLMYSCPNYGEHPIICCKTICHPFGSSKIQDCRWYLF